MAHILYLESSYFGAHQDWIDSYRARSRHQISPLTLPPGDWRWRLHGGALTLAAEFLAQRENLPPVDLLLVNAMVNAPLFLAATRPFLGQVPVVVYFQENQLSYPPAPGDQYQWQDGFVNVASAALADLVAFNGAYLRQDFLATLADFVRDRAEYTADLLERIAPRTEVLPRGIALHDRFGPAPARPLPQPPLTLLWSHRWASEKGVEDFASALRQLHAEGLPFRVILGGDPWKYADLRDALVQELGERVLRWGLLEGEAYADALQVSDVIVACSENEPLGVSVLEALYMGCFPVLRGQGSFPLLIPPDHHDVLYQGGAAALTERLRHLLLNPALAAPRPALQAAAAAFDWQAVIQQYDDTFEALLHKS